MNTEAITDSGVERFFPAVFKVSVILDFSVKYKPDRASGAGEFRGIDAGLASLQIWHSAQA